MEAVAINTLQYDPALCVGCGMCVAVCPHGVFEMNGRTALLVRYEACIECGACALNCPAEAIAVESGVGCAAAMIKAALTGSEVRCGPADGSACCGESSSLTAQEKTGCAGQETNGSGCCG
jgi:NAD-dependent dihydropyrimidine dehydrogenase PreA subunit